MKTTTRGKSNYGAVIIAWLGALLICGGIAYLLMQENGTTNRGKGIFIPDTKKGQQVLQPRKHTVRKPSATEKKQQAARPLPKQHADEMASKAEQMTNMQLRSELQRFQQMASKIRQHADAALDQVTKRRLPTGAPRDANNVSEARSIAKAGTPPLPANAGTVAMYEMLRQYEQEIQKRHVAINAAKRALSQGLSFPEVYNSLKAGISAMPSFDDLASSQFEGVESVADIHIRTTGDLNKYRSLLDQASRQAGLARARLEGLFGGGRSVNRGPGGSAGQPGGNGNGGGGGSGGGDGDGGGDGGMGIDFLNDGAKTPMAVYSGRKLDPEMVKAQALPGRRISKQATRAGWLYVNTWYMIGPWESYGRDDFAIVHPPEIAVDFDAVYTDGKVGEGIAETDAHPLKMEGPLVKLDGTLRWRFMQSESMHNTMPVTTGSATYYAYTELYFDEPATMLVAMGTDDSGRVWINGQDVWQDRGTSWYHIDEHIVTFHFRQGWNKVLVRLENGGGGPAGFSFLICPKNAVR